MSCIPKFSWQLIYPRLGAEEVSNLETPSIDKKKPQERPLSKATEEEQPSKRENNNCCTPAKHCRKDHDPIYISRERVWSLDFPPCQAVNRRPKCPAGRCQRWLSRELVISSPLGDNKAFLASPVQCPWRLCQGSNWASCTSQTGRHQWRPRAELNSHHVQ